MSVNEYRDKFIQLSCYAPAEVEDDGEKQDHFSDGIIGPIKYQLLVHTFENFQKMVDNAIMVEHARRWVSQRGSLSRQSTSATTHALISRPRKEHLFALEVRVSTTGRINTSDQTNRTSSSSKLSVLVCQCNVLASRRITTTPLLEHL
jgi:hypothetical protein